MGSFSNGLYLGVSVALCHGISFLSSKGMPFRVSAMRFMRANGDGVADMRVSGDISAVELDIVAEPDFVFLCFQSLKSMRTDVDV